MIKKCVMLLSLILGVFNLNTVLAGEVIDLNVGKLNQTVNFFWQSQGSGDVWTIQIADEGIKEVGYAIQVNNDPIIPGQTLSGVNVAWVSHGKHRTAIVKPGQVLMLKASTYLNISSVDNNLAEGLVTFLGVIDVK